jgi:small subunit ribosomal protein S9
MAEDERPPEEEPTPEEPTPEEPTPEEQAAEEPTRDEPTAEEPTAEGGPPEEQPEEAAEPAAEGEPAEEQPPEAEQPEEAAEPAAAGEPAEEEPEAAPPAEEPAAEEAAPTEETAPAEAPAAEERRRPPRRDAEPAEEEVVPGAHLEPDLVLEDQRRRDEEEGEFDRYAVEEGEEAAPGEPEVPAAVAAEPVARTPLDLAADARYRATGKRKSAIARVILRPGEGAYSINGRGLDEYFPRPALQRTARQPLEAAGYETRMDVQARIHGGGVSAQAGALRHGIARALVEADPNLRAELKRRGFLTRDARQKERKKAGLKKARKRPQFSKR